MSDDWWPTCVNCHVELEYLQSAVDPALHWVSAYDSAYSCAIGGRMTTFKHRLGVPDLSDRDAVESWLDGPE